MPEFPKPAFQYDYDLPTEIATLRQHKTARSVPAKAPGRLLLATWNLCNFGAQDRRDQDKRIYAEILSWFDIAAVQEVRDSFGDLMDVVQAMGNPFRVILSDVAGNDERLAFIYDASKVTLLEHIGHIVIPPSQYRHITLPTISAAFNGFDRAPYLGTFASGKLTFLLASVHQFYGSEEKADIERRVLETYAVARWAKDREDSQLAFTRDIITLGDFNMPKSATGDPIFDALTKKGLMCPLHSSQMGSNLNSDKHYDQIAYFPDQTQGDYTGTSGVFDFDTVVFKDLWNARGKADFNTYVKYYLSDHRPMWIQFRTI